ncbi:MAG: chromate transporter [Cyclobacteriaceae bacterium]|nr:chromate transporter [Cyclobacteriaceae bacterium]
MYSLWQLTFYFLKLGTLGFGGPVALVEYMHRDLVVGKKWIAEEDYREGLALAQLAPGPLAAQLAIYLGFVHHGIVGATLTGVTFCLPSFLMVVILGAVYVAFDGLPWMQAVFYGVGASVIGIITLSSYKLSVKNNSKDVWLWVIFFVLAITTFILEKESIILILAGGVLIWVVRNKKVSSSFTILSPFLAQIPAIEFSTLTQIAIFFGTAGAFVFGSGLAIVPFLYGGVVTQYGWLNEQQFIDAVAVAMITPGPVVITVGFIGYLVAGFPGACVAALATFLPCYLFTIIPAPYFKKYGKNPGIKTFVDGITAAAVGAIAGAVLVMGKRTLLDVPSMLIAIATLLMLIRFKKIKEPLVILIAALVGLIIKFFI